MTYPTAKIETPKGSITVELWDDVAPNHAENFQKLAKSGFYDGVIFHRIIPGFMIQGGCPDGTGTGGPGWNVDAEFNDRQHNEGVLSMARSQDTNSAGSQFFICLARCPHLDGQYTAFGKVTDGIEVVREIGAVQTAGGDRPLEEISMTTVTALTKLREPVSSGSHLPITLGFYFCGLSRMNSPPCATFATHFTSLGNLVFNSAGGRYHCIFRSTLL